VTELDADAVVGRLELERHPEGGWYRETWRAPAPPNERAAGSAIFYLLERGQTSAWHRIDAAEVWHYYAGSALELTTETNSSSNARRLLGPDLGAGELPQLTVEANVWQTARSLGAWTLVGCTVCPAFEFDYFELRSDGA